MGMATEMQFYLNPAEGRVLPLLPASPGALEESSLGAQSYRSH